MQDWNYVNTNCFEITLELGCVKFPMPDKLPGFWEENKEALLNFMNQVNCENEFFHLLIHIIQGAQQILN